ncbi:hypothetical protein AB0M23_01830 [Streptomyces sp. NPDC052077]|uniref:hypothetical protein n=1 Tax=Streptomyces sp. NPDC052077 TaxID=3154757 RepID=UPI00341EB4FF
MGERPSCLLREHGAAMCVGDHLGGVRGARAADALTDLTGFRRSVARPSRHAPGRSRGGRTVSRTAPTVVG